MNIGNGKDKENWKKNYFCPKEIAWEIPGRWVIAIYGPDFISGKVNKNFVMLIFFYHFVAFFSPGNQ